MKFSIRNRWSGEMKFTAEIDCSEDVGASIKIGLAVRWAIKYGADLRGAVLSGADLRDAVLSGAVLRGAVLSGAVLSGADLRDAVLRGVPVVPNIDAAILASIEANAASGTNGLRMSNWHGSYCNETNWCETTHCRAGYAICLAGAAGFALEREIGAAAAGALIYAASRPGKPVPNFYATDEDAMDDIRKCAAEQIEVGFK